MGGSHRPSGGAAGEGAPAQVVVEVEQARKPAHDLARALARLKYEHRVVIALFACDGLSHGEIAEVLGIPEGTVWSRLHQARKQLTSLL